VSSVKDRHTMEGKTCSRRAPCSIQRLRETAMRMGCSIPGMEIPEADAPRSRGWEIHVSGAFEPPRAQQPGLGAQRSAAKPTSGSSWSSSRGSPEPAIRSFYGAHSRWFLMMQGRRSCCAGSR
jgi:hypothetical protein